MRKHLFRLYLYFLGAMQARCEHPAEFVCADILEGDVKGLSVQWCKVCGAHRLLRPIPAGSISSHPFAHLGAAIVGAGGLLGGLGGVTPRQNWKLSPNTPAPISINVPFGEWRRPEPRWMSERVEASREEAA